MVRTDCHTFDPLFSPPTSAQNPCFYQKLSPKVLFFSHCPEFWKVFTQRPLIRWNLRKRCPNVPNFNGVCHWKTPYWNMVCMRGMLLPQTQSEAGKFCILETELCNLVNTSAVVDTTFVDIYVDTKNIPTCGYNIQHIDKRTMEK